MAALGSSRLGRAIRRLLPSSGPALGAEPALSTGGGGFRGGSRPEPPVRGEASGSVRGAPQIGGSGGGPRTPRGGGGPGPRPERYWTDYLRIALPIIGLILMLSLFIFWVGSIINNGNTDETPTAVALVETPAPSTAGGAGPTVTVPPSGSAAPSVSGSTNSVASSQSSDQASSEPTGAPDGQATDPAANQAATETPTGETTTDQQPTETPAGDSTFAANDTVVVNDDDVNIRDSAGTDAALVMTVNKGDTLTIVSGPESANDLEWYEVTTQDGTQGWIASRYLDPSSGQ